MILILLLMAIIGACFLLYMFNDIWLMGVAPDIYFRQQDKRPFEEKRKEGLDVIKSCWTRDGLRIMSMDYLSEGTVTMEEVMEQYRVIEEREIKELKERVQREWSLYKNKPV